MKKPLRLYNVMFPIYILFLLTPLMAPGLWLLVMLVNFVVDSVVLLLAARCCHCDHVMTVWRRSILRVWLLGFVADIAGALVITALLFALEGILDVHILFHWYAETAIAVLGVALAGWLIYVMDRKWAFQKVEEEGERLRKLALALAVFTAPYTMLVPTALLYR